MARGSSGGCGIGCIVLLLCAILLVLAPGICLIPLQTVAGLFILNATTK